MLNRFSLRAENQNYFCRLLFHFHFTFFFFFFFLGLVSRTKKCDIYLGDKFLALLFSQQEVFILILTTYEKDTPQTGISYNVCPRVLKKSWLEKRFERKKFMRNSETNQRVSFTEFPGIFICLRWKIIFAHSQTFSSLLMNKKGSLRFMCLYMVFFPVSFLMKSWKDLKCSTGKRLHTGAGARYWEERPEKKKGTERGWGEQGEGSQGGGGRNQIGNL